ncbi:patatin-like phospholipase family protein [Planctomicrobium sp. SH661]|uniref:patatin-like phospholipase family protein n=1 Tax=Planctomicrobium sp. SH661 TaxID=3448124 RepID=UPI003F5BD058
MNRIGLALSGGGFRATLFHLGMVRYLRDANILSNVTHITSVSGGSILAAHLVLNWKRYTGTPEEFNEAALEVLRFVQLDIRNRVIRRFPLSLPERVLRSFVLRQPSRRLKLTGLLESQYEKHLFGDTCLYQLPERPRLYMLATNLSEGCLCAFTRDGLLMQRRRPGQRLSFEHIHAGLATVPMAVTASSAFPGFFPPIELRSEDLGANPGRFGRLAFTDGGVYDNLGVRMFRCLEQSWMDREGRLDRDDLSDAEHFAQTFTMMEQAAEDTPLSRLAQMVALSSQTHLLREGSCEETLNRSLDGLWNVMNHENLAREPAFARLAHVDVDIENLAKTAQRDEGDMDPGERLWLNRQLVQMAFQQATGRPCFRSANACFDAVLVSDAGKEFKIDANARSSGLISTSIRASDILMDRVWQLEIDTFMGTPGFVFAPISKVIEPEEDPTAAHPQLQRRAAEIRTDLDRFSPLEISALIRHGYCVGRSACRSRPDLLGTTVPLEPPWDPMAAKIEEARRPIPSGTDNVPKIAPVTEQSRKLQVSSVRRIWSTLFDFRDWISYIYVPLMIPLLVVLPYYGAKWYHRSQVAQQLTESLVQSNRDYTVMRNLLQDGPGPSFLGMPFEEVRELSPPDYSGFEVIADMRVFDLRPWRAATGTPVDEHSWAYGFRRIRIQKLQATANRFTVLLRTHTARWSVRSQSEQYPAVLLLLHDTATKDDRATYVFELTFDLSKVPVHEVVDLSFDMLTREPRRENTRSFNLYVDAETGLLTFWMLMPDDKRYRNFNLLRYPDGKDNPAPETVVPAYQLNSANGQILAFALLSTKPGFTYECQWTFPP